MAEKLSKDFPLNTVLQSYWLPTIRAAVALTSGKPADAIEQLRACAGYELGSPPNVPVLTATLYPVYVRGTAYLALRQGKEAATEFQKFIEHRGLIANYPLGALAHLGLGRAYALQGDTTKARTAYQDFLALWKDADPDLPILKEAEAEYAKLQ